MVDREEKSHSRRDFIRASSLAAVAAGMSGTLWAAPQTPQGPGGLISQMVDLTAEDRGRSRGVLYRRPDSSLRVAVIAMHPTGDSTRDWKCIALAERGIPTLGVAGRYASDDAHHIHEELMLDLAAAVRYLKEEHSVRHVILLGHSGGGQLSVMYHTQAITSPPGRIPSTPAGDPPDLNKYKMIPVEGVILSASHPGRSTIFRERLDPSVVDESDPFATDPDLDMYDPKNGFRRPPDSSKYSEDFIKRYRAAQFARMKRLDAKAMALIDEEKSYKKLQEAPDFQKRPLSEQLAIERRATECHWMRITRAHADPRYTDLSLDASDRIVRATGRYQFRPDLGNYSIHFREPQLITPRAFLSSYSTLRTNNWMWDWDPDSGRIQPHNLGQLTLPLLVICGTADESFPGMERSRINLEVARSSDKSIVWIVGADHSYSPSGPKGGAGKQRDEAADKMAEWIKKRFAA
ncbi:MAG: twin-arginine translocation signal domain-containing protein [Acidobacteria bacterium]|nr:twin-arginine translocation signal domain-containing protein [Acidobacteriota bacterium]